jgi:S1-C subfamily serine protease
VDGNQQSASAVEIPLASVGKTSPLTPTVTRWPIHPMESFPNNIGNATKSGNGFIVDQGRHVITYASLVSGISGNVWVRNGLGKIRKSRVEKILPDQGLALLRLETPYAKEWSLPDQAFIVPNGVHFCFVLGFPMTDPLETSYPIIAPGIVVRPDAGINNLMQITGSLGPENSGSAVFDSSGKFIGMTVGKQEPLKGITDRDSMLGKGTFAVRADGLQKLLVNSARPNKKAAKTKIVKGSPSVEDLYEKLLPAVVTIVVTD